MKWAYSIRQKLQVAAGLGVIFILFFAKNLIDKNNLSELQTSFASVYEDRLLVENYIYQISGHLYQKEIGIDHFNGQSGDHLAEDLQRHDAAIEQLIVDYEQTKFTTAETGHFKDLKQNLAKIQTLEGAYLNKAVPANLVTLEAAYLRASEDLNHLSSIQVAEGKHLTDHSRQIMANSSLLSQFEMVMLIVVALLIQVLLLAAKPLRSKFPQEPGLN